MPSWKKVITSGSDAVLNTLSVSNGITGSLFGTSSYAITASYAENGGVTQIIAGSNVTIDPVDGKGAVTINVITGATSSFTNASTWNFNHNLGDKHVIIQAYDTSYNQIIPQTINLVDDNNATILFPTNESGFAVASLGGGIGSSISSSYAVTASYAITASYALNGGSGGASFPYTGSAIITGSLIITGSTTSTDGFTGSLFGTASWSNNAISSSYAITASYALNIDDIPTINLFNYYNFI